MNSQAEQAHNHFEAENRRKENTSQLILETSITSILKWDDSTTTTKKLQNNILHESRCQNFKQNISKSNPKTFIIIPHEPIRFIPGMQVCFNI